ncbi:MAG: hypothetical protein COB17_03500 [Sulfurimonas sp.]|nr:MAG: hypothetical protein COB17_03500 [Sulfurimonas sp.]
MSDKIIFVDEDTHTTKYEKYNILLVDDEEDMHNITKMALKHKLFYDRELNIISAMSAFEAKEILKKENDIALALIDVIMETPQAGLDLVNYIRNKLNNNSIRLVLRTGQTSHVLEEEIINKYDINDYKEKTELTSEKLYTTVRTSIRQYELIKNLQEKIDDVTNELNNKNKLLMKQSRSAAMGEIITMLAHQWRQPLATISMNNNNLLLSLEVNNINIDSFKKSLELSNIQLKELSEIINDFRDFFKSDTADVIIDINKLIDESCDLINTTFIDNSIKIIKNYTHKIKIKTNKNDLMQIILSLVKNSMDAFIKNNIKDRLISISTKENYRYIKIIIKDNAGGISKEIFEKIFDPYFSTKNNRNGTGLGLYMSKIILEMHLNGNISVITKDKSTTFSILINKLD